MSVDLKIEEHGSQIAKLWTFVRELATAFWGDDVTRSNGLRSDVHALEERVIATETRLQDAIDWGKDVWHVQRPKECIGLAAVEDLRAELARAAKGQDKAAASMRRATLAMVGALGVALVDMIPRLITAISSIK